MATLADDLLAVFHRHGLDPEAKVLDADIDADVARLVTTYGEQDENGCLVIDILTFPMGATPE